MLASRIESATPVAAGGPAAAPALSRASTVKALLAHAPAKAVLERHLPGFANHPQLAMAQGMPLATVAQFSGGLITDELLARIDADLSALA